MDSNILQREGSLYSIKGPCYGFDTGTTSTGMQVLIVVWFPSFVCLFFSQEGDLLNEQESPLSKSSRSTFLKHGSSDALEGPIQRDIDRWKRTVGFQNALIKVKGFFLPRYHIGIRDFPDFYYKVLQNPSNYSEDERNMAQDMIHHWSSDGLFELWLNEGVNLWVNRFGDVVSS